MSSLTRRQYSSDERRRKQRPHVKVHLSWPNHPRYGASYDNRDLRAIVLGVWMVAMRAHAGRTGNRVHLSHAHVSEITACRRPDVARTWLRRAADVMGWSLSYDGDVAVIEIRNFARKQGLDSADRGVTTRTPPPSEEPKNQGTEEPIPTPRSAERAPPEPLLLDLKKAFALHGREIRSWSAARRRVLSARLREHTAEELVSAVHGYQYMHRQGGSNGFDPGKNFTPETIFRAANVEKYIEAAREAADRGLSPPFAPDPALSKNERVLREALGGPQENPFAWKS